MENHRTACASKRTLLVLDEVHHVGESIDGKRAWARAIRDLAGTVDSELSVRGVLNLSGTLWRSSKKERISTVRYRANELGGLTSDVDFTIGGKELIQAGELRPIDLFRLDARVEVKDWAELSVSESDIADLDEKPARAAVRALAKSEEWRTSFVTSVLNRLEQAHYALDGHHSKALIVASYQEDARLFCDEVDRQMRARGLQPLAEIAISDEKDAEKVLDSFRLKKRVGVLCTVGMAGEGYDCPDIAVVGYASNKLTNLYVRQVVARAMRVTDIERKLHIIPAAIVVPDIPLLVDYLVHYLKPQMHDIALPEEEPLPRFVGGNGNGGGEGALRWSRFEFENIEVGKQTVTVSDGEGRVHLTTDDTLVAKYADLLVEQNVPQVFAPRAMAAIQRLQEVRPFDRIPNLDDLVHETRKRQMTVEEECRKRQQQLHKFEGWWRFNGDSDVKFFAADANREAGIKTGEREQATPEQLRAAVGFEASVINQYCERTGKRRPKIMNGEV